MRDEDVRRGARIYSRAVLGFYDQLVVRFSNTRAWRCPSPRMLERYDQLLGQRHLDVGPGTGWYLDHAAVPAGARITLMDLNHNSLDAAARRISRHGPEALIGDVLSPLPAESGPFDSIGVNYLMHCLPGTWRDKGRAFAHLSERLSEDGTLFGATILGRGVRHNLLGRGLMSLYNALGIFHNRADDERGLRESLERSFAEVSVDVNGTVALFTARGPLRH